MKEKRSPPETSNAAAAEARRNQDAKRTGFPASADRDGPGPSAPPPTPSRLPWKQRELWLWRSSEAWPLLSAEGTHRTAANMVSGSEQ